MYNRLSPPDAQPSSVFMEGVLKRLHIDMESPMQLVQYNWEKIIGENFSRTVSLKSIENGVMTVKCQNSSVAGLLRLNSREIIKRVTSLFPDIDLKKIKTVV